MRIKIAYYDWFRVACSWVAPPSDTRSYLRGVFVDPARGEVTASDGHRLIRVKCLEPVPEDDFPPPPAPCIVKPQQRVPPKGGHALDLGVGLLCCEGADYAVEVEDGGSYPNVDGIIGKGVEKPSLSQAVCLDAKLLADAQRTLRAPGVLLAAHSALHADHPSPELLRVRFLVEQEAPAYVALVAPVRIDDTNWQSLFTVDPSRS